MKILLTAINAKYIHSNLAVYSLKAYAKEFAKHIVIGEYSINQRTDYILEQIYKQKPEVLCFSCYIWNIAYVEELIQEFHKLCPNVPIWLGGPEVSFEVETFLKEHPQVTGILIGEGERNFYSLCEYYVNGTGNLADLSGIAFHKSLVKTFVTELSDDIYQSKTEVLTDNHLSKIQTNPVDTPMDRPMNLSEIPFCYEEIEDFKNRIIYYESSRGCPFHCSYCLSSVDKKLRFRDLELVKKELAFFIEKEVPQVKFVDRTFNCVHEHAMEIWKFIKKQDRGITNFHFEISADLLNEEELNLLASMRAGLVQLEIGVQSVNEPTISEIHRSMNLERLKENVKRIQEAGNIHQHLDLIAGLPYEGLEAFAKSFDEIYALKPNQLQLGFLKVLKGSYMYEHAKDYKMQYHTSPPYEVMQTKWLTFDEVLKIKQVEEMLEVYYNSGQFEVTMKLLEKFFDSPFEMFAKLGVFYEEQGYLAMSHSRIRRCEILLEFVENIVVENFSCGKIQKIKDGNLQEKIQNVFCGNNQAAETDSQQKKTQNVLIKEDICELIKEGLTFDLYYRENCKSRPSWAVPITELKQLTKQYCKKGSLSHIEPFHYCFPDKSQKTLEVLPKREEKAVYVLFDYQQRDPLDHQAKVSIVE